MSALRIRWRACGLDHADRKGEVPGAPDLWIGYNPVRGSYELHFDGVVRADFANIKAARKFAEANIGLWITTWRSERSRTREAARIQAEQARQADARHARLVAALAAYGVDLAVRTSTLTITEGAARDLLRRLSQRPT
jgi:hypothetical protein